MEGRKHSHEFVQHYQGLVGFGLDRQTDEHSLMIYLQKFSDDGLMAKLIPRMGDREIEETFLLLSRILREHLNEREYHDLFLKD
ncbi:MAG TPA: cytoplasmic protein [Thermodesulfobacteriota bacterium]|nr:cytoplasmic protein [Thermodesulfobacteriota bacterium]